VRQTAAPAVAAVVAVVAAAAAAAVVCVFVSLLWSFSSYFTFN